MGKVGEAYYSRAFRDQRAQEQKELGSKNVTKSMEMHTNPATKLRAKVWIVEWDAEPEVVKPEQVN